MYIHVQHAAQVLTTIRTAIPIQVQTQATEQIPNDILAKQLTITIMEQMYVAKAQPPELKQETRIPAFQQIGFPKKVLKLEPADQV